MTREAKIGMLTGLGVIVTIGVLLSSYLGDGGHAGLMPAAAANRMSPLPVGENYRQQTMQPVGVPAMAAGGTKVKLANGTEVLSPMDTTQAMPVAMMAADVAPAGPVVGAVVSPVPTGPTPVAHGGAGAPPTIEMNERVFDTTLKDTKPVAMMPEVAPAAVTYTVAAGDNLAKIAKKFYNSGKNSDIARIVKANPTMLKDASTPLMVNKKLAIPGVKANAGAASTVATSRVEGVVVYRPGNAPTATPPVADANRKVERPTASANAPVQGAPASATAASKVYEVKAGDSLEKIARRIAPSKVTETVQKLMTINGMKNKESLQAGAKIKLPA